MIKHGERPSDHITETSDIPPSPEAVYNHEKHIKDSFLHRLAWKLLLMDAQTIESQTSRRRLRPEEKAEIMSLRKRAESLKLKMVNPDLPNSQLFEAQNHLMTCPKCKQEIKKIRGDLELPVDDLLLKG